MKTIDELAWEAYDDDRKLAPKHQTAVQAWIDWFTKGFHKGAESEHAELTRWNDPKEHPEEGKMVLVKRTADSLLAYDLAHVANGEWVDSWCGEIDLGSKIIGWREIHQ